MEETAMIPSGSRTGSFTVEKIDKDIELIHSLLGLPIRSLCNTNYFTMHAYRFSNKTSKLFS